MSKFCTNCGKEIKEGESFCTNCGNNNNGNNNSYKPINKNIVTCVILSLITCGIYGYVWLSSMTEDINKLNNTEDDTSGVLTVIYTIITCKIYLIFWAYSRGKDIYNIGQSRGKNIADNSIIYLVLSLFNFDIVNYCLIQNDLNSLSE